MDTKNDLSKKTKKKKSILFKIVITLLSILIILMVIGAIVFYSLFDKVDKVKIDTTKLKINEEDLNKYEEIENIKNIAFFGIDAEEGQAGRSDAIMILTIDSTHKKLKLTSIMRDSYVDIEGHGMDKINHAYAFGGPELAIQTINTNFGLNVDDFVAVNFSSLPEIIDLLGGVDITITAEEVPHITGIDTEGPQTLTGEQALSYSRIRYATGGDFVRTDRQRTVLNSLFSKFSQMPITSYPELVSNILPHVKTSMNTGDILSLATKSASLIDTGLKQDRYPHDEDAEGIIVDGIYYLSFDLDKVKKEMMDYIFDDSID